MKALCVLALLVQVGGGWSRFAMGVPPGHSAVVAAMVRVGEGVAEMPDPESLLLMGVALCCGAALCVYRAARAKRASAKDVRFNVGSLSRSGGL